MFDKVDDSEVKKLSAELDSMSKALDDMTFVAVKPCCLHAPHRIEDMIKRHETIAKEYPYQKTIQDMIRENLAGGEFVIMMVLDRGKARTFK